MRDTVASALVCTEAQIELQFGGLPVRRGKMKNSCAGQNKLKWESGHFFRLCERDIFRFRVIFFHILVCEYREVHQACVRVKRPTDVCMLRIVASSSTWSHHVMSCHVASQRRPSFCSFLDLFPSSPLQLRSDTCATQEGKNKEKRGGGAGRRGRAGMTIRSRSK
jgi:hypothetical protein